METISLASSLSHWGARSCDPQTVLPGSLETARRGGGGGAGVPGTAATIRMGSASVRACGVRKWEAIEEAGFSLHKQPV